MKIMLVAGRELRERYAGALYAKGAEPQAVAAGRLRPRARDVDALLLPTTPWRAHELRPSCRTRERVLRGWANLVEHLPDGHDRSPAISLPLAEADGLPVGVMLVGRHFDDARLLAIAATCERALGWAQPQ